MTLGNVLTNRRPSATFPRELGRSVNIGNSSVVSAPVNAGVSSNGRPGQCPWNSVNLLPSVSYGRNSTPRMMSRVLRNGPPVVVGEKTTAPRVLIIVGVLVAIP